MGFVILRKLATHLYNSGWRSNSLVEGRYCKNLSDGSDVVYSQRIISYPSLFTLFKCILYKKYWVRGSCLPNQNKNERQMMQKGGGKKRNKGERRCLFFRMTQHFQICQTRLMWCIHSLNPELLWNGLCGVPSSWADLWLICFFCYSLSSSSLCSLLLSPFCTPWDNAAVYHSQGASNHHRHCCYCGWSFPAVLCYLFIFFIFFSFYNRCTVCSYMPLLCF